MLELQNFSHMTTSTKQFDSQDKTLLVRSRTNNMTSKTFFQNIFIVRRPKVAIFADLIKIATMFIQKKTLKDSKKS